MAGYLIAEKLLFWFLIFIQKEQYAPFVLHMSFPHLIACSM